MATGFDFSAALSAKASTSSRITPGVHDASFVKIEHSVLATKNGDSEVLALTIDVKDHGEYTQNFFKPDPSKGRTDGMYGPNPSQMEHFQILLREILEAVNPDFMKDIESGELKLGGTFKQLVNTVANYCAKFKGAEFKVKFMPQSNGYASIPTFPAAIARDGKTLRIANVVIGANVTLTASEERKIKAAAVAAPTNMANRASTADLLGAVGEDLGLTSVETKDEMDDMPF